jgi:hypothetical protein
MYRLMKYSLDDWLFAVIASLIAAVIFYVVIIALRWLWRWIRNLSPKYRRADQTTRIVKIFVYRGYMQKKDAYSLSRGQFFLISRFLLNFTGGIVIVAMGAILSWLISMEIGFYLFLGLAMYIFIAAASWFDSKWSQKTIEHLDEQALSDAAAILDETIEELRSHVTRGDA